MSETRTLNVNHGRIIADDGAILFDFSHYPPGDARTAHVEESLEALLNQGDGYGRPCELGRTDSSAGIYHHQREGE